jgi:hypothetical protein
LLGLINGIGRIDVLNEDRAGADVDRDVAAYIRVTAKKGGKRSVSRTRLHSSLSLDDSLTPREPECSC